MLLRYAIPAWDPARGMTSRNHSSSPADELESLLSYCAGLLLWFQEGIPPGTAILEPPQ